MVESAKKGGLAWVNHPTSKTRAWEGRGSGGAGRDILPVLLCPPADYELPLFRARELLSRYRQLFVHVKTRTEIRWEIEYFSCFLQFL